MLWGITGIASCADDPKPRGTSTPIPPDPPPAGVPSGTVVEGGDTAEAMDALKAGWAPSFEPDYNTLQANPDVQIVSKDESDDVVVTPTQLIFSAAKHPEIGDWAPGRLVVSGPGTAGALGKTPLGFARRVTEIKLEGNEYVVETVLPAMEELFEGEIQQTFDPDTAIEVPLEQLDLEWAAKNLYQDADISPGPDSLTDSYPVYPQGTDEFGNPLPGQPGWGFIGKVAKKIGNAVGISSESVASAPANVWVAVTPSSFEGSAKLTNEYGFDWSGPLFLTNASKNITSGKFPMALSIKGKGDVSANIAFNPGLQIGMRVPNKGHNNVYFSTWLNIDSYFRAKFGLDLDLEAAIESAAGKTGTALDAELNASADFAQNVLNEARNRFMGDEDVKPAGGWKKTLYISSPSLMVVPAGPIPVVLTQTFQLDLECGFEAKASLKAKLEAEQAMTFKFSTSYDDATKKLTATIPEFTNLKNRTMQVTGGGEVSLTCGLIPRHNVFFYDTVGINTGIRASVVARAKYESTCPTPAHPTKTNPSGEIALGLYGNVGLQVGVRLQVPGSSYAGTAGHKAGFDVGPVEPYNTEFSIWEQKWAVGGLGYCTPTCKNLSQDGSETDVDCGNLCSKCDEGQQCSVNGDCAVGYCSNGKCSATNHCGDGILDGDETGVDCGGAQCGKCANGRTCILGSDCLSGSCRVTPGSGSLLGTCVADHCQDNTKSGDETGIDCGGKCKKCDLGVVCADGAGCASGYSNGYVCVANLCSDLQKSPTETDIDCGGPQCAPCGLGKGCQAVSDCVMVSTTECQTRACDAGICSILNTQQNTPAPGQTAGDCLLNVCDGNGATVLSNDDLDVENDNNPCTDNSCSNGMKVTNSTPANTSCGAGGNLYCDGNGTCVGCTTAAQCGTPANECLEATCVAGVCGTQSKTNGTGCNDNNACTQADSCSSGAVYVFTRSGATWVQQAYLKASNTGGRRGKIKTSFCMS